MAKQQQTEFYVRTNSPDASFVDHETGFAVHGNGVTLATEPLGKKTRQFLQKGGLVRATEEEVAKAQKKNRVSDGNAFETTTKIVMVPPDPGTPAHLQGMPVPKEVPLEDGDKLESNERPEDDPNAGVHGVIDSELGLDDVLRNAKGVNPAADEAKKRADEDPAKGAKSVPRGEGNVKTPGGVGPNKDTDKK